MSNIRVETHVSPEDDVRSPMPSADPNSFTPAPGGGIVPHAPSAAESKMRHLAVKAGSLLPRLPDPIVDRIIKRGQRSTRPSSRVAAGTPVLEDVAGGVRCTWLAPELGDEGVVVFLHGGSYLGGPGATQWAWLAEIQRRTGLAAAMVLYRMPPIIPFLPRSTTPGGHSGTARRRRLLPRRSRRHPMGMAGGDPAPHRARRGDGAVPDATRSSVSCGTRRCPGGHPRPARCRPTGRRSLDPRRRQRRWRPRTGHGTGAARRRRAAPCGRAADRAVGRHRAGAPRCVGRRASPTWWSAVRCSAGRPSVTPPVSPSTTHGSRRSTHRWTACHPCTSTSAPTTSSSPTTVACGPSSRPPNVPVTCIEQEGAGHVYPQQITTSEAEWTIRDQVRWIRDRIGAAPDTVG